jgi:ubiquinol-cytochrome c reductase cytochrome b subunit
MGALRRSYRWLDKRLGISAVFLPILRHPVPRTVNWWYVFGSSLLVVFVVQVVTGVALAFSYVPSPDNAYQSIDFITHDASWGHVVRGIHYWGASAMVLLIAVHASRVFLTGSFKYPRELNWLTGVVLLVLSLGMAFTGQLLRWDEDAYWAVVVAAEQAGRVPFIGGLLGHLLVAGQTVGGATLTRFYATHVFLLPALLFALIGMHLYLVVHHGISEPPQAGVPVDPATYEAQYNELLDKEGVPFWPDAAWRDAIAATALVVGLVVLAITLGPKDLSAQADPTVVRTYPRPDWYFLWLFALLALSPPKLESWLIVGLPLISGAVLLALPFFAGRGERSPRRRPWAIAIVGSVAVLGLVLVREGTRAPWSPDLTATALPGDVVAAAESNGIGEGAQLFASHGCISCHTIGGTGGQRGPDLTAVGNRLSETELKWRILQGGHNMPAYGEILSPTQLRELIAFLEAQKGG